MRTLTPAEDNEFEDDIRSPFSLGTSVLMAAGIAVNQLFALRVPRKKIEANQSHEQPHPSYKPLLDLSRQQLHH